MPDELDVSRALVVLSGGQDSTTCIGIALQQHDKVEAISFDYGQRHKIELESAKVLCAKYGIPHKIIVIDFFEELVTTALIGDVGSFAKAHPDHANLPSSFVPNRNALFLTLAHAYAQTIKADVIYAGMCQTDYSGYPDCRDTFIRAMENVLNLGAEVQIELATPLMYKTKAEAFALAEECNFLEEVIEYSHTCYEGRRDRKFDWGYGCGECPSCKIREQGYVDFLMDKEDEQ